MAADGNNASYYRWGAVAAGVGGVLALVGNLLAPRYNGLDFENYRRLGASDRQTLAISLLLVAILLVTAGLAAVAQSLRSANLSGPVENGRLAVLLGGTIAVAQFAIELYAYRQQARAFSGAGPGNEVSAFWATNSVDHVNAALFDVWTIVLLGIAPLLLGIAMLGFGRYPTYVALTGVAGGAVCICVGFVNLLKEDQSSTQWPFLIGSLLVTVWVLAAAYQLWPRDDRPVAAA